MKKAHTFMFGISFLLTVILLGCAGATNTPIIQMQPSETQNSADRITSTITPVESSTPKSKATNSLIATETDKPTENISTPRIGVGILRSMNDPDGTGEKDFILGENGAIIATYPSFATSIGLSNDSCFIYGIDGNSKGIRIRKLDWNQDVIEENSIPILPEFARQNNNHSYSLSPNGEWVSYVWPSGKQGMDPLDAENLNLELMNVHQEDGIQYKVTVAGGATKQGVSWSPDGKSIAFSDRDKNGIYQLYLLDLSTKSKLQISSFDQTNAFKMREIQFSPKGDMVAFAGTITHKDKTLADRYWYEGKIGVIHLPEKKTEFYQLPDVYYNPSGTLYWNDAGNRFVTVLEGLSLEKKFSGDSIAWFATSTGKIVQSYPEIGTRNFSISAIFPLKGIDRLVLYGKNSVYDVTTSNLKGIDFPNLCCSGYFYIPLPKEVNLDSCSAK